jgi:hypothetical protein
MGADVSSGYLFRKMFGIVNERTVLARLGVALLQLGHLHYHPKLPGLVVSRLLQMSIYCTVLYSTVKGGQLCRQLTTCGVYNIGLHISCKNVYTLLKTIGLVF